MKPTFNRLSRLSHIALAAATLTTGSAFAGSDSWKIDADGNWDDTTKWTSTIQYPDAVGDIATFDFNLTAGRSITLSAPITLGGLVFNDTVINNPPQGNISNSGYKIQLGTNNLTLDTGTAGYNASDLVLIDVPTTNLVGHQINATTGKIVLTDNVQVNVGNNVEFSFEGARLTGAGNILKTGTGNFLLSGDNTASGYTGNIRLEGGILQGRGNNKAFGTGTITYVNSATRIAFFNYGSAPTSGAVIANNLILEKAAASSADFVLYNVTSPNLTWSGNISNTGAALAANLTNGFETGGLSYAIANYTGDNSGLTFAAGKGFTANANYIGVGSHNALGAGNTALVAVGASGNAQTGLLATIATTIASPITVSGNGNNTAAVIGANITSGTVNYTGTLTLNAAANNNVRQIFLRSETGSTVAFSSASLINNAATNGQFAPLTKIGGGRVELNGNNTYIGNSAVRSGELVVGHANAFGAGSTTINLGETTPVLTDVRVATAAPGYTVGLGTFTSGVGNPGTFTGAPAAIDGVTLAVNDRVLVKDRNNNQNGIYVVSTLTPNVWVRATDLDTSGELAYGQQVKVTAGTVNAGKVYFQGQRGTTGYPGALTLNTSPLDYHLDIANPNVSLLNNGVTINRDITVVANGSTGKSILGGINTSGTSTFSGVVTLDRDLTLTAASGGSVDFSNDIIGSFGLTKEGPGKVVFSTIQPHTGALQVAEGILEVNDVLDSSSVTVASGATLQGIGTIANIITAAGTIAPGNGVGTLTANDATLTGTLAVEIDGATGDKLLAYGPLNLSGATLTVTEIGAFSQPSYVIAQGSTLTGTFGSVPLGYNVTYTATQAILTKVAGSDYDTWKAGFGPGFTDTATTSDPDNDGLTNQQEYAFGLNPTLGSSVNPITVPLDKTTGTFTYTRRKLSLVTPLAYTVKTSTDLATWTPASISGESITTAGDIETVVVTLSGAPLSAPKLFVRVSAQ